jgi:hypothetical protein
MIPIYVVAFALLVVGGVASYLGFWVFDRVLTNLETKWPQYYAGAGPDFAAAFMQYLPVFVIFGVIIYVMVQSQKPPEVYYA